jgi:hypothetical protein
VPSLSVSVSSFFWVRPIATCIESSRGRRGRVGGGHRCCVGGNCARPSPCISPSSSSLRLLSSASVVGQVFKLEGKLKLRSPRPLVRCCAAARVFAALLAWLRRRFSSSFRFSLLGLLHRFFLTGLECRSDSVFIKIWFKVVIVVVVVVFTLKVCRDAPGPGSISVQCRRPPLTR